MATISWGKGNMLLSKYPDNTTGGYDLTKAGKFLKVDTPVNGSTSIEISEGEKHEAEIEGGDVEAVKYDADKSEIQFDIRRAAGRPVIALDNNGNITGTYAVAIQPEDKNAPAILAEAVNMKRTLNYSSADGIIDHYVASCIAPASGNTIKVGVVSKLTSGSANTKTDTKPATINSFNEDVAGTAAFITFAEHKDVYSVS